MVVWCEQRACCHNASGRCVVHSITLGHWEGDFDSTLNCTTFDRELEVDDDDGY